MASLSLSKLRELVMDRDGVLQSMGSQRVGHDRATELIGQGRVSSGVFLWTAASA